MPCPGRQSRSIRLCFGRQDFMEVSINEATAARKLPRRGFARALGCLCHGQYAVGRGVEIGEGGISFVLTREIPEQQEVVLSFQVPGGSFISVRAELIRLKTKKPGEFVLVCLFKNLKFVHKREIRTYVSARSEHEQ